jgi:HYR domain-containing protein
MHMRHYLRQFAQLILGGTNPRAGTGLLTCSVTLASALWVSVSVPNLPLMRGLDDRTGTSVAISLQSALLGIDDRSGHVSNAQALAHALGLSADVVKLLSPVALSERANALAVGTAFDPVTAQIDPLVSVEATPAVQPPDAPVGQRDAAAAQVSSAPHDVTPSPAPSPAPTHPADTPAAAPPVAVAPHPKSPSPAPATPSPSPQQPAPTPPVGDMPHGNPSPTAPASDPGPSADPAQSPPAQDTAPPMIQAHADLVADATGPGGAAVSYTVPSATDAVDGTVVVTCAPASGHGLALGHTTVHCTAHDEAHNVAHSSFDVLVHDTTPPTIQAHADIVTEAGGPSGSTVTYTSPSASDAVDGAVSVSCAPASGSLLGLGHTTVTCSALDAAGNAAATRSFDVHVRDTTAPAIQAHPDVVVGSTGSGSAIVSYSTPTASDSVDGSVSVTCVPASGTAFAVGHTTVTCTAQDATHNVAHSTFDVEVTAPAPDTTPPAIQAHADIVAEAGGAGGATVTYTPPSANDAVDGAVSVSCAPASGTLFGLGHTTVTCSAQDAAGNAAPTQTFDVHVRDTTAPTIQAHADIVAEATGPSGATVSYTASAASDSVDGSVSVTCAPASGTTFALGHTTVSCSAQDGRSNVAHSTFDVQVRDTTAPVIQVPADMTVPAGTPATFTATATDAVDGSDPVTCAPASGTTFAAGQTVVTCTAQDAAGNQAASQSFSVFGTTSQSHSDTVHALLDIDSAMKGLGLSHAVEHDLHGQLLDTAHAAGQGDHVATCQTFDAFTVSAAAQLTAGQFASLTPSINAARTTLGC